MIGAPQILEYLVFTYKRKGIAEISAQRHVESGRMSVPHPFCFRKIPNAQIGSFFVGYAAHDYHMLIFAAILEAFPRQLAGFEARVLIGVFMLVAWLALFILVGRREKAGAAA